MKFRSAKAFFLAALVLASTQVSKSHANDCSKLLQYIQTIAEIPELLHALRTDQRMNDELKALIDAHGITVAEVNALARDGLPIFKEVIEYAPSGRTETFELFGGLIELDIQKTYWMIENGKLNANIVNQDVTDYAESAYGLNRSLGSGVDTRHKKSSTGKNVSSFGISIDREYAAKISDERLDKPGIPLEYDDGKTLIIDGNHRAAKRYMIGKPKMNFYLIKRTDLEKIKKR